jgi:hypothetical protein
MLTTKENIRRYLLLKQLLLPSQSLNGQKGINKVFNTIRSIQFDPLNPCGNNVDLTLQARVNGIHPQDYYLWLYKQRKGIEFFDKELCIVPIKDFSSCKKSFSNNWKKKANDFIQKNSTAIDQLILRIKKDGEISSSQIKDDRKINNFWGNPRWGRATLEILWRTGKLTISKRENGRKYYDLPSKIYGKNFIWTEKNNINPAKVIRRIRSVGLLPKSGTGQGWLGLGTGKQILPVVDQLLKKKLLTEIEIEGIKKTYVMSSSDVHLLKRTKINNSKNNIVFLAPLDNLLWDRNMIKDIFDFEYKWEVYTPKHQRKYGHYALPILYGDKLIGRIEPRQVDKTLEIRGLWLEPNFQWNKIVDKSFNGYLNKFKDYLGVQAIEWLCEPPKCSVKSSRLNHH